MTNNLARSAPAALLLGLTLAACAPSQPAAPGLLSASSLPPAATLGGDAAQSRFPGAEWMRVDPVSQGFSPDMLERAVASAKAAGSTSGMVVAHGLVLVESAAGAMGIGTEPGQSDGSQQPQRE
jgi:hypothetical protein